MKGVVIVLRAADLGLGSLISTISSVAPRRSVLSNYAWKNQGRTLCAPTSLRLATTWVAAVGLGYSATSSSIC